MPSRSKDAIRCALEPPYSGLLKGNVHADKTFKIAVRSWQVTVSADTDKLAYVLGAKQHDTSNSPSQPRSTAAKSSHATTTTTTGSVDYMLWAHRMLPGLLQNLSPLLHRRGGDMWEHPHIKHRISFLSLHIQQSPYLTVAPFRSSAQRLPITKPSSSLHHSSHHCSTAPSKRPF
jgi:hypothetical protein